MIADRPLPTRNCIFRALVLGTTLKFCVGGSELIITDLFDTPPTLLSITLLRSPPPQCAPYPPNRSSSSPPYAAALHSSKSARGPPIRSSSSFVCRRASAFAIHLFDRHRHHSRMPRRFNERRWPQSATLGDAPRLVRPQSHRRHPLRLVAFFDMASFSFAPQSLLAPFGALTLIINLLVAAPLHGDSVGRSDLISTFLVVSGVATCLANANTDAIDRTYDEIISLFYRPQFHGWVALVVSGLALAAFRLKTAGTALCYPLMAGGLGGCTTLCAKLVGELGKASAPWYVAAIVGICIPCFAVSQLTMLNAGLGKASSLVVVPVFVATFVTCNAVGGGIFFDEFAGLTESQSKAYPLGLAMLVAGVLVLAGRSEPVASGKKAK